MKLKPGTLAALILVALFASDRFALAAEWIYTVRPGDNFWNIAERYTKSMSYWQPLLTLNNVEQPRQMPPGMQVRIPIDWLRLEPTNASVVSVRGDVEQILEPGAAGKPLQAGMELELGVVIVTGPESSATISFADGSELLVRADSRLTLDTIRAYEGTGMVDTRMRLDQGRVESAVRPAIGPGSRFEIHTPSAITSVRGTDLRVGNLAADETTQVEVVTGTVGVSGAAQSRLVRAGFGTVVRADSPPLRPRPLLPPPDLGSEPVLLDRLPFRLRWPDVEGATAYLVHIAEDEEFQTLLVDLKTEAGDLPGTDLADGEYVIRVRAIDEVGLEGLEAKAQLVIDARPEPPLALKPTPEEVVRIAQPEFVWSAPANADRYWFQLAPSADFAEPLTSQDDLRTPTFAAPEELPAGEYFWRVATKEGEEIGPFGDPQPFTVRPSPASPGVEPPELSENRLVLRWRSGYEGQRYQYELAGDNEFRDILASDTVATPQAAFEDLAPNYYFFRVRTIDTDGYAGDYGTTQRFYVAPGNYWPAAAPLGLLLLLVLIL